MLSTDFTRFQYNIASATPGTAPGIFSQADRTVVKGVMEYPTITPGYYVRPKISFQSNTYNAIAFQPGYQPAQGFLIPTVSLDSGLALERDALEMGSFFGREMLLSLEPRAFYVYTPYVNQANTPLFDTADQGFACVVSAGALGNLVDVTGPEGGVKAFFLREVGGPRHRGGTGVVGGQDKGEAAFGGDAALLPKLIEEAQVFDAGFDVAFGSVEVKTVNAQSSRRIGNQLHHANSPSG